MKVLLVNPPYEESVYSEPPLGLAYIAAMIEKDFTVKIFDCAVMGWGLKEYAEELKKFSPDVVGITATTPTVGITLSVAKLSKEVLPEVKIVAGGPHVTLLAESIMKESPYVDFAIMGEGEYAMRDLVLALRDNKPLKDIKGLIYRENGNIVNNGRTDLIQNLDALPFPARHLLPMNKYSKFIGERKKYITMMSARGCPYNCIFCAKSIFGRIYRERSVKNVIEEIEDAKEKFGIKEVLFYDDSFTFNRRRVVELCDEMINRKLHIKWNCKTRVNIVDEELLKKMRQAGCYLISYGVESAVQKNLNFLRKGITPEQVEKAFKMTKKAGIQVEGYFVIGIPGETVEEIEETIKFAKKIKPDYAQFSILTPLPETDLYTYACENKLMRGDVDWSKFSYFGDKTAVTMDVGIPQEKLIQLRNKAMHGVYMNPGYVLRKVTSIRSIGDVKNLMTGAKILLKWGS